MIRTISAARRLYSAAFQRRPWLHSLLIAGLALLLMRGFGLVFPIVEENEYSRVIYDRKGRLLRLTLAADGRRRLPVDSATLPAAVVQAFLLQEDRWFYFHPGINPLSVVRATRGYLQGSTRSGGASTITMQLVRLRYRMDTRSPPGKALQMLGALWFELCYSKRAILSAYLTLAPFGGNIEGIEAASLVYFQRRAVDLSLPQALLLAVAPKSPELRAPSLEDRPALRLARDRLLARWRRYSPNAELPARGAEARAHGALPEFRAPHFTRMLLQENNAPVTISTIDLEIQSIVEEQSRAHLQLLEGYGVRNVSALLLNYRTMEVLAWLGSANYRDVSISGQVDGVRARRSPGSTLKPFLYALAIDQGLIHPLSLLKDAPATFGLYSPENFDRDFEGPLSATQALIRSRNVPAVYLASQVKNPSLYEMLEQAGVQGLKPPSHYQLAIALGVLEMRMDELALLYAALARGGQSEALRTCLRGCRWRLLQDEAPRLFSEEAAFLTLDMLRQNPRLDRSALIGGDQASPIYWKTGTSMGFRDAWSAGIFDDYVLIVWAGDFDGSSNAYLSGGEAAAPLMFRIIDAMRAAPGARRSTPPGARATEALSQVEVCALSGDLPGEHCPHRRSVWFIPGKSPIRRCQIHREVLVDPSSGLRLCGAAPAARREVHEFWPSDLMELYVQAGAPRTPPPEFAPHCAVVDQGGAAPQITAPLRGASHQLRSDSGVQRIALSAIADGGVRRLYWFANDLYLGDAGPMESFFWAASPGRYTLVVVDDRGRTDSMELTVIAERAPL